MEYKTTYEADEKGYRATGDHLPVPSVPVVRSLEAAPGYVFKYDAPGSHSHYMTGEPGKSVQGSFTYNLHFFTFTPLPGVEFPNF